MRFPSQRDFIIVFKAFSLPSGNHYSLDQRVYIHTKNLGLEKR